MKICDTIASWWRRVPDYQKRSGAYSTLLASAAAIAMILTGNSLSEKLEKLMDGTRDAASAIVEMPGKTGATLGQFRDQSLDALNNIQKPQQ